MVKTIYYRYFTWLIWPETGISFDNILWNKFYEHISESMECNIVNPEKTDTKCYNYKKSWQQKCLSKIYFFCFRRNNRVLLLWQSIKFISDFWSEFISNSDFYLLLSKFSVNTIKWGAMTSSIVWELFILCHRVLKGTSTVWGSDFQNFHCPSKNPLLLEKNPPLEMTMQGWLCPSPYKCWSSSACVSCSWVEQVHSKDSTWLKQTIERVWLSHPIWFV